MEANSLAVLEHENDAAAFERLLDITQRPIVRDRQILLNAGNRSLGHTGELSEFILR